MISIPQFTGKVYPDKSFSIGIVPRKKKKIADKSYDREYTQQFDSFTEIHKSYKGLEFEKVEWLDGRVKPNTNEISTEYEVYRRSVVDCPTGRLYQTCLMSDINIPFLDNWIELDARFNKSSESSQSSKNYGLNGITRFGRRMVKNGAVLLEKKYGIGRLGFITATIPTFDQVTIGVIASNWSEVTRRFFQKLKRHLERLNLPLEIVCCTEIQEKRFRRDGVVAPHLHFIYVCKQQTHEKKFNILACLLRRYWRDSVMQVVKKECGLPNQHVSFSASIDAQVIRKSAAAYLGKYISKGGEILQELIEKGFEEHFPKQWWTASKVMKAMIKDSIIRLDSDCCNFMFYNLGNCIADGWLSWCNFVDVETKPGEYMTVGCVGVFSEEYYDNLLEGKYEEEINLGYNAWMNFLSHECSEPGWMQLKTIITTYLIAFMQ